MWRGSGGSTSRRELGPAPVSRFDHPVATQFELHFVEGQEDFDLERFDAEE